MKTKKFKKFGVGGIGCRFLLFCLLNAIPLTDQEKALKERNNLNA